MMAEEEKEEVMGQGSRVLLAACSSSSVCTSPWRQQDAEKAEVGRVKREKDG